MLTVKYATAGRRDWTAEDDASAHRADPRRDRRLEHVAREAGVFADDDARRVRLSAGGDERDGAPEREGELRRHRMLVRYTSNAVGAEEAPDVRGLLGLRAFGLSHARS